MSFEIYIACSHVQIPFAYCGDCVRVAISKKDDRIIDLENAIFDLTDEIASIKASLDRMKMFHQKTVGELVKKNELLKDVVQAAEEVVTEAMKPLKEHNLKIMMAADQKLFDALQNLHSQQSESPQP